MWKRLLLSSSRRFIVRRQQQQLLSSSWSRLYHHVKKERMTTMMTIATAAAITLTSIRAENEDDSVSEGAAYLRKKILPFRETYRQETNDDVPLPRVRILKQGSSTYVASFQVGSDADVIGMISSLIRELQKSVDDDIDINIHTALPRLNKSNNNNDALISFVLSDGNASVLLVRRSSGRCELSLYRENEMLRKSDLDAIAEAYIAAHSGELFTYRMKSMYKIMGVPGRSSSFPPGHNNNNNNNKDVRTRLEALGARMYDTKKNQDLDWNSLAGYESLKQDIQDTLILPLRHPETFDNVAKRTRQRPPENNRPSAILFAGPPGTGKTTSARIIASTTNLPMIYVPLDSVMSKWYGESEKHLAQIFDVAEELGDAIVFIDEVDALATRRSSNMHEATRRILSVRFVCVCLCCSINHIPCTHTQKKQVLLRRLEGVENKKRKCVVICATNRRGDLDPALRSRFDLTLNFDLPELKTRIEIMRQYAKHLDESSLNILAKEADGMSGRDLRDVCEIAERRHAAKIVRNEVSKGSVPCLNEYISALHQRMNDGDVGGVVGV